MTRNGWIFAGSTAALAGAFALSLAQTPTATAPQAAIVTPDPVSAPALAAVPAPAPVAVAKPRPIAPAAKPVATPAASGVVPGSAGMVIAIDPETGTIGTPSAEQLAEMKLGEADIVSRDQGGIVIHHPSGAIGVDFQGRNQDYAVIRRLPDGKVVSGCLQHPGDLEHTHLTPTELEEK